MGRSSVKEKEANEESFYALLQRIQRQYHVGSGSAVSVGKQTGPIPRPPDEAAYSLGKGLAQSFLNLATSTSGKDDTTSDNDAINTIRIHVVPKSIQEKTLVALADRSLNPSICQGFFDRLIDFCEETTETEKGSGNEYSVVNMDAWLPAWILYAEQRAMSDRDEMNYEDECYEDDWLSLSLNSLTCMIRSYAKFVRINILYEWASGDATNSNMETIGIYDTTTDSGSSHPILHIGVLAKTYSKLQTQAGRLSMLREFTTIALRKGQKASSVPLYKVLLTPLIACSVLSASGTSLSNESSTSITEAVLCMEGIWKEAYNAVLDEDSQLDDKLDDLNEEATIGNDEPDVESTQSALDKLDILQWLTDTLNIFMLSIPTRSSQAKVICTELSYRWFDVILELGQFLASEMDASRESAEIDSNQFTSNLKRWFDGVLTDSLLQLFALIPSYRMSMKSIWDSLGSLTSILTDNQSFSLVAAFKLATMAISHPIIDDIPHLLSLLAISIESTTEKPGRPDSRLLHTITFAILRGLGSIFLRDKTCALATANLLETLSRTKRTKSPIENVKVDKKETKAIVKTGFVNVIQLLEKDPKSAETIIAFVSSGDIRVSGPRSLSPIQQSGLLMFGIGLLDNASRRQHAFAFFKSILRDYPHLGVSLLPVMVDSVNAAAIRGEAESMMDHISFLCEALVQDTLCAREIWNLLGIELMRDNIPATVRSSIIRYFPTICRSNKRLYKRIVDSMGQSLLASSSDEIISTRGSNEKGSLEVRLAIAASTSEMARDDMIRDPTDVIGWIQGFIRDAGWVRSLSTRDRQHAPGRAALVHYAILSLHYLVLAEELDFKLVLVVLGKRLCAVNDMKEVSKLPPLVLESLILLLGDGESGDEDTKGDRQRMVTASVSATKSVETLINLWHSDALKLLLRSDPITNKTILQCRKNIFASLSRYSFEALGLEEESIQEAANASVTSEDEKQSTSKGKDRYSSLKYLIDDGIMMMKMSDALAEGNANHEFSNWFSPFTSRILQLEENSLGSTLWQKKGNVRRKGAKKEYGRGLSSNVKSDMYRYVPSSSSVLKSYTENKCQATALGALLAFEGRPLSILYDLARDGTSDPLDPLTQAFFVQAWLNATRNLLLDMVSSMSSSDMLDRVLLDIQEWRVDNPDAMYMCLSCIAMLLPDVLGRYGDHSSYVKDIANDVWEAYDSHVFDDPDVARLCLSFVAVCDISRGSTLRLVDIVKTIEASVTGYGGQPSFGAFFALAVIAQSCSTSSKEKSTSNSIEFSLITRVVAFLVSQLSECIRGSHEAILNFVKSVERGEITPEVIESLTAMKKKSLKIVPSKLKAAKSIFISFAICLPALTNVNDELLLGIYCLLESLAWGCGKGFCLPVVLHVCQETGLFDTAEIEKMYQKYAKLFETSMESGADGLDDIFYAVTAIQSKSIPYSIRKFMVGNKNLFDESGRALSLVSVVVSVSSVPCLGRGSNTFLQGPRLSENISKDDVTGVTESVSEGMNSSDWNQYSQMASILMGFMASIGNSDDAELKTDNVETAPDASKMSPPESSQLPIAHQGTALEVVINSLQESFKDLRSNPTVSTQDEVVMLLGCLEQLSLPGPFADAIENIMRKGSAETKAASMKVVVSQIRGRPRAVFDARDFINLTLKMSKMPVSTLGDILGDGIAAEIFIENFGDMLAKFVSQAVEEASEGVFRYCLHCISLNAKLTVMFFDSLRVLLAKAAESKTFRFSPKAVSELHTLLLTRFFAGIRDAMISTTENKVSELRKVLKAYADCLNEIPCGVLQAADFHSVKELDGFYGESLRIQIVMMLVQRGYFESASRSYTEISLAIAWSCRQLVACNDEIFSCTILRVACTIAQAGSKEAAEKRKDLLISLLDNLLLVSAAASFVGLELLAALVYQWCRGCGSNGDLSLLFCLGTSIEEWLELSPLALKDAFNLAVHDLPYNMARFTRQENLSKVVLNRLWRIYVKCKEQGASVETLEPLKKCLICCRDTEIMATDDLVTLVTSMVMKQN